MKQKKGRLKPHLSKIQIAYADCKQNISKLDPVFVTGSALRFSKQEFLHTGVLCPPPFGHKKWPAANFAVTTGLDFLF